MGSHPSYYMYVLELLTTNGFESCVLISIPKSYLCQLYVMMNVICSYVILVDRCCSLIPPYLYDSLVRRDFSSLNGVLISQ